MKPIKNLFFAGLALLATAFTSCNPDGGGGPPSLDEFLASIPAIEEEVRGRSTISVSGVSLEGDGAAGVTIPQQTLSGDAGSFSVASGKLTLDLKAPSPSSLKSNTDGSVQNSLFWGHADGVSFSSDAKFYLPALSYDNGSVRYEILRLKSATDEKTYMLACEILYVYVDKDCTITAAAKSWTETFDDTDTPILVKFSAINLELKEGWNLMQRDQYMDATTQNVTQKIADKDVPWYIAQ
jgi:hypothetical protein